MCSEVYSINAPLACCYIRCKTWRNGNVLRPTWYRDTGKQPCMGKNLKCSSIGDPQLVTGASRNPRSYHGHGQAIDRAIGLDRLLDCAARRVDRGNNCCAVACGVKGIYSRIKRQHRRLSRHVFCAPNRLPFFSEYHSYPSKCRLSDVQKAHVQAKVDCTRIATQGKCTRNFLLSYIYYTDAI